LFKTHSPNISHLIGAVAGQPFAFGIFLSQLAISTSHLPVAQRIGATVGQPLVRRQASAHSPLEHLVIPVGHGLYVGVVIVSQLVIVDTHNPVAGQRTSASLHGGIAGHNEYELTISPLAQRMLPVVVGVVVQFARDSTHWPLGQR
jgi:hypothetical protein